VVDATLRETKSHRSRHKEIMAEPGSDEVLAQFNRLIEELLGGNLHRSTFQPWEIVILLDMSSCDLGGFSKRRSILREYQKAVQQHMEAGARTPLKLSEYMESFQVSGHRRKPLVANRAAAAHGR
jgi:hypothetical protein